MYLPSAEIFLQLLIKQSPSVAHSPVTAQLLEELGLSFWHAWSSHSSFCFSYFLMDCWLLVILLLPQPWIMHTMRLVLFFLTGTEKQSSTSQQCILVFDIEQFVCGFDFAASSSSIFSNFRSLESLSSPVQGLFLLCVPRTTCQTGKGKHQFTTKGIICLNISSLTHIDFYFRRQHVKHKQNVSFWGFLLGQATASPSGEAGRAGSFPSPISKSRVVQWHASSPLYHCVSESDPFPLQNLVPYLLPCHCWSCLWTHTLRVTPFSKPTHIPSLLSSTLAAHQALGLNMC